MEQRPTRNGQCRAVSHLLQKQRNQLSGKCDLCACNISYNVVFLLFMYYNVMCIICCVMDPHIVFMYT